MTTDLATRTDAPVAHVPMTLPEKMKYAEALASANLLPRAYQKQPGNVLLAMELGDAMGIPAIQAINDVHVIEGKPSASANLIGAMVRKAGHKLRVNGDDTYATAQVIRADDPDFTFEVTWTLDRAKTAGLLTGKGNWSKYPAAMLKARAITEVARSACPDALYGVTYTPEELGAVVTEDGDPVANPNPAPVRQQAQSAPSAPSAGEQRVQQAKARRQDPAKVRDEHASQQGEETTAEAHQEPMCTPQVWANVQAAMAAQGITDPAQIGETVTNILGRPITGPGAMTLAEAHLIVEKMTPPAPSESDAEQDILPEPEA